MSQKQLKQVIESIGLNRTSQAKLTRSSSAWTCGNDLDSTKDTMDTSKLEHKMDLTGVPVPVTEKR